MNKFTLGAITGLGSIALAIPVLATVTSAQSVGSSSTGATANKPVPSTQCVQAISALESQQISLMDGQEAARKAALQAHVDALNAAASITDDTQRQAAIQKANQDLKTAMQNAMQQNRTTLQSYEQAVQTACGKSGLRMGFMGKGGMMGAFMGGPRGHMMGRWNKNGIVPNVNQTQSSSTAATTQS